MDIIINITLSTNYTDIPGNKRRRFNVGLMLGDRLRRRPNIKPTHNLSRLVRLGSHYV